MDGMEDYLRSLDDGLVKYKEEFSKVAVKNDATLKYLRPYEVEDMNIPRVYRRMLIDRIINLQTPDTKARLKEKCVEDFCGEKSVRSGPKRLKFETDESMHDTSGSTKTEKRTPAPRPRAPDTGNFLDKEVDRLNEERDTLSVLLLHKKDELSEMKRKPLNPPTAIGVPGNAITKSSCDNCHRKGHRSIMNRGNKSCPYEPCEGYQICGIEAKHPDHKHAVIEVTKEINDIERRLKNINDELNSIKMFQNHNNTNFVSAMRPLLKTLFPIKYEGKDGAQNLQRDLRYIKIATNGQIPEDQSPPYISSLIAKGNSTVTSKIPDFDAQPPARVMPDQQTNATTPSTDRMIIQPMQSPTTASVQQQPLQSLQSSPFHVAQYNPYLPTPPYPYLMYPNQVYDVYGNYMYPMNLAPSSTVSSPPLPFDSPPKNPPLPKDPPLPSDYDM